MNCPGVTLLSYVPSCLLMPRRSTFSFKLIYHLFLLSGHKISFKAGENCRMIKYGTLTEAKGYDQRIVGQPFNSFKGLISAKFQNFDAD